MINICGAGRSKQRKTALSQLCVRPAIGSAQDAGLFIRGAASPGGPSGKRGQAVQGNPGGAWGQGALILHPRHAACARPNGSLPHIRFI